MLLIITAAVMIATSYTSPNGVMPLWFVFLLVAYRRRTQPPI
ncbi:MULTISPECIES: hypothetical protein [Pseudomonas]|nr:MULTISPECIES: hypothetical protein [Pseudomonas]MDH0023999.1 hypothetical protein [Pseudomonas monteilii]WJR46996.1 hypothetical protein LU654_010540 [Pseudomonas monteilii]